jgi:hypothetical protein
MESIRDRLSVLIGRKVDLALDDGTRLDGCQLVSLPRSRHVRTAWIVHGGDDAFVAVDAITDIWEVSTERPPNADLSGMNLVYGSALHSSSMAAWGPR